MNQTPVTWQLLGGDLFKALHSNDRRAYIVDRSRQFHELDASVESSKIANIENPFAIRVVYAETTHSTQIEFEPYDHQTGSLRVSRFAVDNLPHHLAFHQMPPANSAVRFDYQSFDFLVAVSLFTIHQPIPSIRQVHFHPGCFPRLYVWSTMPLDFSSSSESHLFSLTGTTLTIIQHSNVTCA